MLTKAVILVNPTFRISHVVKLAKKYKFTPICVLTIEKPLLLNFEENYSFMKKLNPNTEVFRTYTKNTSPEELNKIFRSKYNVQAVVPYEDDLLFAEKLAKLLNVACNDFNSLNVRKDKYKFNELLAHNHVPSAKQMMVEKTTKTDDIIKYFNNTFPIVIKPIDGAASVSVYICKNKNDLTNAIQGNNVFKSKFVAQEFIDGDEYIVNFVTYKSKHYLTNISVYDRRVVDGHVIDFGHCAVVEQNKLFKDLEKYGKDVLNVSGVNCGTTHLEIKLSKRGPILIECNWRVQGAHDFVEEPMVDKYPLYELSLFSYWPELKQSKDFFKNYSLSQLNKNIFLDVSLIAYEDGLLKKYRVLKNKKLWKSFHSFEEYVKEGTRFSATINYITIMGQIELKHKELSVIKSDKENIIYAAQYQHELLWE